MMNIPSSREIRKTLAGCWGGFRFRGWDSKDGFIGDYIGCIYICNTHWGHIGIIEKIMETTV